MQVYKTTLSELDRNEQKETNMRAETVARFSSDTKEDLNRDRPYSCPDIKIYIPPKLIYKFSTILIKVPA